MIGILILAATTTIIAQHVYYKQRSQDMCNTFRDIVIDQDPIDDCVVIDPESEPVIELEAHPATRQVRIARRRREKIRVVFAPAPAPAATREIVLRPKRRRPVRAKRVRRVEQPTVDYEEDRQQEVYNDAHAALISLGYRVRKISKYLEVRKGDDFQTAMERFFRKINP